MLRTHVCQSVTKLAVPKLAVPKLAGFSLMLGLALGGCNRELVAAQVPTAARDADGSAGAPAAASTPTNDATGIGAGGYASSPGADTYGNTGSKAHGNAPLPRSTNNQSEKHQSATTVASVNALLATRFAVGTVVEFSGFAQAVQTHLFETPAQASRDRSLFCVSDERFPLPNARVWLDWTSALVLIRPWPRDRSYVRVRAISVAETSSQSTATTTSLDLLSYEVVPAPVTPAVPPTYPDGSWSVHDLYRRADLELGLVVDVTAYVYEYDPGDHLCHGRTKAGQFRTCPTSQPPAAFISDTKQASEDAIVLSARRDANEKLRALPKVGGPYRIRGTFTGGRSLLNARAGAILVDDFSLVRTPPRTHAKEARTPPRTHAK
jgi:hypothetical protein